MKYIKELREGENVIEHYLCKSRASMKSRNGKTYLSLKLQDKTGIVDAKVWDMNKDIQSFQENDFIKVDAFVTTFNNELQLNVKRIRRSREGEYDPADFIPSTDKYTAVGVYQDHSKSLYQEAAGGNFPQTPCHQQGFQVSFRGKNHAPQLPRRSGGAYAFRHADLRFYGTTL